MKLLTLKVDEGEWEQWKFKAKVANLSLSAWIRILCNSAELVTATGYIVPSSPVSQDAPGFKAAKALGLSQAEYPGPLIDEAARVTQSKMEKPRKPVDMTLCQHNMYKSACPRCK